MYILKYVPTQEWLSTYSGDQDLGNFDGAIYLYADDGKYLATMDMSHGSSTSSQGRTSDCPPNDSDSGGSDTGNDGTTGDTTDGGDTGGIDIPIDIDAVFGWRCNWRNQIHDQPGSCNNPGAGGEWVILVTDAQRSVANRTVCPPPEENCVIDCEGAIDPVNCECVEEEEEIEGADIPVIIDISEIALIFNINGYLEPDLTPEQTEFILENPEFADAALEALENEGDVDFDEHIIYDFSDKPCQKNIIETVISNSSEFTDLMNNTFNSNGQTNLRFSTADISTGDPIRTAPFPDFPNGDTSVYYVDIQIDNSFLENATDLSIAGNVLHELVHAYLINFYITSQMSAESSNYNDLLNAFIGFYDNSVPDTATILDNEIHNAMINFIENAGESLFNYAQEQGISVDVEYCTHLIWGTMFGTELFEEALTEQEQINYGNIAAIEQENESFEGNAPQGSPCD